MKLTERQKKYLRRAAHDLKPVITVGDKGITDALIAELESTLEHHELIKIRFRVGDRNVRDTAIEQLVGTAKATLVSRVGNIAAIYRPAKENPKIVLPKPG
ncbi:MAG: ribosome assembly RNA-binding protein YhbY [Gammaproteobacteria bacterium]|jgi:RNA-binding protein|nr:ribosome assembly RNA-binding protein YhbY [Gammaproteobacteria bacterium]MDP6615715.1 ribosome assembly RNA-binding protein YhbY [Gammaproteobacteria bacterium]MDP6695274.1 ribosome assembly RNA-binding protein YhbY [Gammaproteobacteria bacterium]